MKVLMVNGSPHKDGCTHAALSLVAEELGRHGVESEILWLGREPVRGCIACNRCKDNRCFFDGDPVNAALQKAETADGFVFGTPVHYAAASGAVASMLDRFFFAGGALMYGKPGTAVVSCRRGGASASFDQLNKYFTIAGMPIVSSTYWNMVHGSVAEDVAQDPEAVQNMRVLGKNMAWLLRCIEAGREAGIHLPAKEDKIYYNYIR